MTVQELIKELQGYDPSAPVVLKVEGGFETLESVDFGSLARNGDGELEYTVILGAE